ncbi:MAG: hypothetical protein ACJA08_001664 [Cyclobacteriaceae bacterium]|jgi:hypothetical protein
MDQLKHDWLTEGLIDYEYKKYVLLAYLKNISQKFNAAELYPFLSDLVFHFRNLEKIRDSKKLIFESFPKSISKTDFKKLEITYRQLIEDDEVMKELVDIIGFAIPKITEAINEGKELYEFVEKHVELQPVGLSSIYEKEGYLLISQIASKLINVYRYQVTLFESAEENFRGISTTFIDQELKDYSRPYEHIKVNLARRFRDLPNPATFLLVSKLRFPENSTLLPVAKRLLIRNISIS